MIPSKGGLRLIPNGKTVELALKVMELALRADPARVEVKVDFDPRVNWLCVKAWPIPKEGYKYLGFNFYANLNGVDGTDQAALLFDNLNHYIKEC